MVAYIRIALAVEQAQWIQFSGGRFSLLRRSVLLSRQRARRAVVKNALLREQRIAVVKQAAAFGLLTIIQRRIVDQLCQRIFRITVWHGGRSQRMGIRQLRRGFAFGEIVGNRKLFRQAVPDFAGDGGGSAGFFGYRFTRSRYGLDRLRTRNRPFSLRLLRTVEVADQQLIIIDAQNVAILQLNLTTAFQRNIVEQHARHIATVSQATFTVRGDVHNGLQPGERSIIIRQHQIVIHAATNGAAGREEITMSLRRLLAGFSRYYRKAHNGFLRLAVRHLYRAPLGERRGV